MEEGSRRDQSITISHVAEGVSGGGRREREEGGGTGVDGVDGGAEDEGGFGGGEVGVDTPNAEGHVVEDGEGVFAAVGEVREPHSGAVVAAETLHETPEPRESGEETHYTRVRGVALGGVHPFVGVQTEEEFDILGTGQLIVLRFTDRDLHP